MTSTRLWIQSDIHNDVGPYALPKGVEADVAIVAGDVGGRLSGQARLWLEKNAPADMPLLVVAGNHDFYGASLDDEVARFRRKTTMGDRIQVLDGDSTIIGGVRFVGATLWTDFNSYGDGYTSQRDFMAYMTDWRAIRWEGRKHTRHIRHYIDAHHRQLRAIEAVLSTPFDGPTVVITHHAPSVRSLEDGKATKALDAAYASDLDDLIRRFEPDLWIHGHVHHCLDYMLGRTRVVCNPRGYVMKHASPKSLPTIENRQFNPGLVLDVEVGPRPGYDAATVDHAWDHPDIFLSRVSPPIASTRADHAEWPREAADIRDENDEPQGPTV
ncbi:metallophosphoesterase [Aureimonas sp. AU40]|uniref:metallophosphoesterase n=1 Tax=Aureimonas sp. AU40 TaxID=1637747 RepID=UPI000783AF50|nr:metallophosphoesterase [Aureimonas sp. AU40]